MCNLEDLYEYITLLHPRRYDMLVMTCGPDTDVETARTCHETISAFIQGEGLECSLVTLPNEIEIAAYCRDEGINQIKDYIQGIMSKEQYEDFIRTEFIHLCGDDLK